MIDVIKVLLVMFIVTAMVWQVTFVANGIGGLTELLRNNGDIPF
ncbi:hypothetical protein [Lactobacillus crispatus]